MSIEDSIIGLYVRVDSVMAAVPKHPQAELYPSELVTLGLLFALRGDGQRRFYRWLSNNDGTWVPRLPERTRLFRLLATHADWTEYFLAQPTLLGVADTYGIELIHPWREDRSEWQLGRKGLSNHRWIVGPSWATWSTTPAWWWRGTTRRRMRRTTRSATWSPTSPMRWWS